jgi:hypothetical protein
MPSLEEWVPTGKWMEGKRGTESITHIEVDGKNEMPYGKYLYGSRRFEGYGNSMQGRNV